MSKTGAITNCLIHHFIGFKLLVTRYNFSLPIQWFCVIYLNSINKSFINTIYDKSHMKWKQISDE